MMTAKQRRVFGIASMAAAAVLVVTGCSSGGGSNNKSGGEASDAPAAGTTSASVGGSSSASAPSNSDAALGGASNASQLDQLYQAAKSAGDSTLTIYTAHADDSDDVWNAFMSRYPSIKVTAVNVSGPTLESRIDAEFGSGKHVADIVATGITSAGAYAAAGKFQTYRPFDLPQDANPAYTDPNDRAYALGLSPMGFIYNKSKVSDADAPKSWSDVVDPKWKNDIAVQNTRVASGANGTFAQLLHDGTYGADWIAKYVALNPRFESSGDTAAADVANGVVDIAGPIQYNYAQALIAQGANVGFVFPLADKNYFVGNYMGIVTGAPHPNAAKLFIAWLLTPEGAKAQAKDGFYTPVSGAPAPEGLPPFDQIQTLNGVTFADYSQYTPLTNQVKKLFGG